MSGTATFKKNKFERVKSLGDTLFTIHGDSNTIIRLEETNFIKNNALKMLFSFKRFKDLIFLFSNIELEAHRIMEVEHGTKIDFISLTFSGIVPNPPSDGPLIKIHDSRTFTSDTCQFLNSQLAYSSFLELASVDSI